VRKKGCFIGRPGKGKTEKDQLILTIGNKNDRNQARMKWSMWDSEVTEDYQNTYYPTDAQIHNFVDIIRIIIKYLKLPQHVSDHEGYIIREIYTSAWSKFTVMAPSCPLDIRTVTGSLYLLPLSTILATSRGQRCDF